MKPLPQKVILVIILIAGILVGRFVPDLIADLTIQKVKRNVEKLYELANPGIDVEVVGTERISGMYRVLFKARDLTGTTSYREVYITEDGKLLTENVILVEESISQIEEMKNLVDCLYEKGLRIYGITNSTLSPLAASSTFLQLNLLGRYSWKIYTSCDGRALQACMNAGITQLPSVVYEQRIYPGIKTVDWLKKLTGC